MNYLLNTNTDIVQALCAVVTIILAIAAIVQGNRIKELADIVKKLKRNNKVLTKRFDIESIVTRKDRMPIFVKEYPESSNSSQQWTRIFLKNIGIDAARIKIKEQVNEKEYLIKNIPESVKCNDAWQIEIYFYNVETMNEPPIDFTISFESHFGIEHTQRIFKVPGDSVRIELPKDFIVL
jgi:hypothetical protein